MNSQKREEKRVTAFSFPILFYRWTNFSFQGLKNDNKSCFSAICRHFIFFTPKILRCLESYLCSGDYSVYLRQITVGSWVSFTGMIYSKYRSRLLYTTSLKLLQTDLDHNIMLYHVCKKVYNPLFLRNSKVLLVIHLLNH